MNKKIEKQKGITLVALVVTIIVLLVLSGVTISTILGDNGIIAQAQKAKNEWENAEQTTMSELQNLANELEDKLKLPLVADGSYSEEKGANTPKLGTGMTPIKWDSTANGGTGEWIETTGADEDWYNYTETDKKWANAKTEDGSMWVWIPRYAYQIESGWHQNGVDINSSDGNNSAGKINIKFLKGTSNTASDGTSSWDNASGQGKWNVHPAFSYGSNVAGIWVAKFEASQSDATSSGIGSSSIIKVQDGVQSWRNISISDIYTNCLNYNSTLNSHQMKNSEWGAIAYLAQSSYGKNSEVWINNSSSSITGSAGNSVSANQDVGTTNDYTSNQGVNSSTTGNIYGIYDMSGGLWEYVAAYVNNGHSNLTACGNSLITSTNAKTKEVYESSVTTGEDSQSVDYTTAKEKYGDAVYEISATYFSNSGSWYGDFTYFPSGQWPFFFRGGSYEISSTAGLFAFDGAYGGFSDNRSFRPVLIVL